MIEGSKQDVTNFPASLLVLRTHVAGNAAEDWGLRCLAGFAKLCFSEINNYAINF